MHWLKNLFHCPKAQVCTYLCALLTFLWLATVVSSAQESSWSAVSLGFSPQVLLNHQDAMWAAGSGGSIAASVDGGKSWKLKHADLRDGLLLVLGFTTNKFGYAAGTGKRILLTEDGGETWSKVIEAPAAVWQAAFADVLHGVVRTRESLLSTVDGGKS
jgi:photosystem II stability/assembly factor-like uncharacterized protein